MFAERWTHRLTTWNFLTFFSTSSFPRNREKKKQHERKWINYHKLNYERIYRLLAVALVQVSDSYLREAEIHLSKKIFCFFFVSRFRYISSDERGRENDATSSQPHLLLRTAKIEQNRKFFRNLTAKHLHLDVSKRKSTRIRCIHQYVWWSGRTVSMQLLLNLFAWGPQRFHGLSHCHASRGTRIRFAFAWGIQSIVVERFHKNAFDMSILIWTKYSKWMCDHEILSLPFSRGIHLIEILLYRRVCSNSPNNTCEHDCVTRSSSIPLHANRVTWHVCCAYAVRGGIWNRVSVEI